MLGNTIRETWSKNIASAINLVLRFDFYGNKQKTLLVVFNFNGTNITNVELGKNDFPINFSSVKIKQFIYDTAIRAQLYPDDIENILIKNKDLLWGAYNDLYNSDKIRKASGLPYLQKIVPKEVGRFFTLKEFIIFFYIKLLSGIPEDVFEAILIRNEAIKSQMLIMSEAVKIKKLKNSYLKKHGNFLDKTKVYLSNFLKI